MEEGTKKEYVWNDSEESKYKDRPFNAWRVPRSDAAEEVIKDVINQLLNYEKFLGIRQRKRKEVDQESFERMVSAVICDMIYHYLTPGADQKVYISRSNDTLGKKSRYRPPALGKKLPTVLDWMASPEMGLIQMSVGKRQVFGKGKCTTIKAGPRLINQIKEKDLTLYDLGKEPGAEVIHLKREKDDYWDDGDLIEYSDTSTTQLYRQQMEAINDWLDSFDIMFNELVLDDDRHVDTMDRSLRRIFTKEKFDHGGRLFGGFWQPLGKIARLEGLHFNDESIVELDYGQMGPRILYGIYDATPPEHDAYLLTALRGQYRKGVKKVFSSLIFDDWSEKPRTRMPRGVRKHIPKRYSIQDLIRALKEAHPMIADSFGTGVGHKVQFRESQILVALLLQFKDEGIPALPVHDAVLVPHSMKDDARRIMLQVFKDQTGVEGLVTVEEA